MNPPMVVAEVVITWRVDLMITSTKSSLFIGDLAWASFIWDKTMIESLIESPIKPMAPIVAMKPKFCCPIINPIKERPIERIATERINKVSLKEFNAKTSPIVINKI